MASNPVDSYSSVTMEMIINCVALGCSALALILDIVAIALPSWFSDSDVYYGLWKYCTTKSGGNCVDLSVAPGGGDWSSYLIMAIRGLTITGLLLLAAAIAMAVLKMFVMKDKVALSSGASASASTAGSLILTGAIIFVVKTVALSRANSEVLGAGFRLAVVAGIIPLVAGIMFKIGKNKIVPV